MDVNHISNRRCRGNEKVKGVRKDELWKRSLDRKKNAIDMMDAFEKIDTNISKTTNYFFVLTPWEQPVRRKLIDEDRATKSSISGINGTDRS